MLILSLDFVSKYKDKIAIVVNCVDRLQRSYKDTPALDKMRKEGKIEVHFLKEKLILKHDSSGMEIMFWNMCVLMANSYVQILRDDVMRIRGELRPHIYEPLITKELFDQVQSVLAGKSTKAFRTRNPENDFIFKGLHLLVEVAGLSDSHIRLRSMGPFRYVCFKLR